MDLDDGEACVMDAEQARSELERIQQVQGRVRDEALHESRDGGGPAGRRALWTTAAALWVFLAVLGLDMPQWAARLFTGVYVAALLGAAALSSRRRRMALHRSEYDAKRLCLLWLAGVGGLLVTVVGSGMLAEWADLPLPSVVQATVSAAVFVLVSGPLVSRAVAPREKAGPA